MNIRSASRPSKRKDQCKGQELAFSLLLTLLIITPASVLAQVVRGEQLHPGDPNGMYGACFNGGNASVRRKLDLVVEAGQDPARVKSIHIIDCRAFDGPGGSFVVPCPTNTHYSYCVLNQNDGVGNHILLGVNNRNKRVCTVTARRPGPPAQIDITFRNAATGISVIEFRGGVSNAQTQFYAVDDDRAPIILTATKVDKTMTANLPNIRVTDEAGNLTICSFSF